MKKFFKTFFQKGLRFCRMKFGTQLDCPAETNKQIFCNRHHYCRELDFLIPIWLLPNYLYAQRELIFDFQKNIKKKIKFEIYKKESLGKYKIIFLSTSIIIEPPIMSHNSFRILSWRTLYFLLFNFFINFKFYFLFYIFLKVKY